MSIMLSHACCFELLFYNNNLCQRKKSISLNMLAKYSIDNSSKHSIMIENDFEVLIYNLNNIIFILIQLNRLTYFLSLNLFWLGNG